MDHMFLIYRHLNHQNVGGYWFGSQQEHQSFFKTFFSFSSNQEAAFFQEETKSRLQRGCCVQCQTWHAPRPSWLQTCCSGRGEGVCRLRGPPLLAHPVPPKTRRRKGGKGKERTATGLKAKAQQAVEPQANLEENADPGSRHVPCVDHGPLHLCFHLGERKSTPTARSCSVRGQEN